MRTAAVDEFLVAPETDVQRENDLKPGEVLTAVLLPPHGRRRGLRALREAEKLAFDWPIADVAVVLERDADGRCRAASVVLGAAAPVPRRARAAEEVLVGEIDRRGGGARCRPGRAEGGHAAAPQSPQTADFRRPGAPRVAARRRAGLRRCLP